MLVSRSILGIFNFISGTKDSLQKLRGRRLLAFLDYELVAIGRVIELRYVFLQRQHLTFVQVVRRQQVHLRDVRSLRLAAPIRLQRHVRTSLWWLLQLW